MPVRAPPPSLRMLVQARLTRVPRPEQASTRAPGRPFHLAVSEAVLDDDILANAVAQAPQAFFERFNEMERLLPGTDREPAHPVGPSCRLLRPRGQRPRRGCAA